MAGLFYNKNPDVNEALTCLPDRYQQFRFMIRFFLSIFLISPFFLFAQKQSYRHPSILGAHFFLNNFNNKSVSHNYIDPGIGIFYTSSIHSLLDWNIEFNSSFSDKIKKNTSLTEGKKLFIQTTGFIKSRLFLKPYWIQSHLQAGLGAISYEDNFHGFVALGTGLEFHRKNIFIEMNTQYRLPLSKILGAHYYFSIGIAGLVRKNKRVKKFLDGVSKESIVTDRDADGITDLEDVCPDRAGVILFRGCPDSDGDGIEDKVDQCVQKFGFIKYKGCPVPDTDKDGIDDEEDQCIAIPGSQQYHGCPPPDTDNDGVNNEEDDCVQFQRRKLNNGSPIVGRALIEEIENAARNILFETGSHRLSSSSYEVLEKVAVILKQNPDLKLIIEGHTDQQGTFFLNQQLSENRAKAVFFYLKENGVNKNRLRAVGYGPTKPVGTNGNAMGRAKNRRVALILYQ